MGKSKYIDTNYARGHKQAACSLHPNFCHRTAVPRRICTIDLSGWTRVNVQFTICLLASNFHLSDWPVWLEHRPEAEVHGERLYCLVLYLFLSGLENSSSLASHHPSAPQPAATEEWTPRRSRGSCLPWLHQLVSVSQRMLELWVFQQCLGGAWAAFRFAGEVLNCRGVGGSSENGIEVSFFFS